MKLFGRFRRTPPPTPGAVRESLMSAMYESDPKLSDEEFESLYTDVWKAENQGKKEAGLIINNFMERRKHDYT